MFKFLYLLVLILFWGCVYWIVYKKKNIFENIVYSFSYVLINNLVISTLISCVYPFFSLQLMTLLILVESIVIIYFIKKRKIKRPRIKISFSIWSGLLFLLFIFFAVIYLCFPIEYLDGGRDTGLYYLGAIRIYNTGGWLFDYDAVLDQVYSQYGSFLRPDGYPALYLGHAYDISENYGYLVPQFLPGTSSLFSIAYAVGGYFWLNRINGLIGFLTLCLLYLVVKEGFQNCYVALLSTFLLGISPAFIWNSRETNTEILVLFLILISIYLEFNESERYWKYILEGFFLGLINIIRIDGCILSVAVLLREIIFIVLCNESKKKSIVRVISYCLVTGICIFYLYVYSYPYFLNHKSFLMPVYLVWSVLILIYVIVLYFLKFVKLKNLNIRLQNYFHQKNILFGIISLLIILFKIVYFLRPSVENAGFRERALVEFSWYTSAIAIVIAIFGVALSLFHFKIFKKNMLLFAIGFGYFVVYIYKPSISSDHMWASRRWVDAAIPIILICASYALVCLQKKTRIISMICIISITGYILYQDAPFLFKSLMKDLHVTYEEYAVNLDDDCIYFTPNGYVASVLRYVYGKKVYIFKNTKLMEEYLKDTGEIIYLIDSNTDKMDLKYEVLCEGSVSYSTLEKTIGKMPKQLETVEHVLNVYKVFGVDKSPNND